VNFKKTKKEVVITSAKFRLDGQNITLFLKHEGLYKFHWLYASNKVIVCDDRGNFISFFEKIFDLERL